MNESMVSSSSALLASAPSARGPRVNRVKRTNKYHQMKMSVLAVLSAYLQWRQFNKTICLSIFHIRYGYQHMLLKVSWNLQLINIAKTHTSPLAGRESAAPQNTSGAGGTLTRYRSISTTWVGMTNPNCKIVARFTSVRFYLRREAQVHTLSFAHSYRAIKLWSQVEATQNRFLRLCCEATSNWYINRLERCMLTEMRWARLVSPSSTLAHLAQSTPIKSLLGKSRDSTILVN